MNLDCWLAVDPGVKGGMAVRCGDDSLVLKPFTTESDFLDLLDTLSIDTQAIVEEVPPYVGRIIPSSSAFKLGYNYGFEVGAIRAYGFRLHLVRPQKWQKGLAGLSKTEGAVRKRKLKDNAKRLYPRLKGITLQTCDALLLLDYWTARMQGLLNDVVA